MKNGIENYPIYEEKLRHGDTLVIIKVPGYKQAFIDLQPISDDMNIFSDNESIRDIYLRNIKRLLSGLIETRPDPNEDE